MTSVLTHTESGCHGGLDGELLRVQLAGNADAAGRARRELARLRTDLDPPLLESVRLLVTELVTNSIRHADAAAMELAVAVSDRDVHVEVANPGGGFEPRPSGPRSPIRAGDCSWSTACPTTGA
jgi:signal transduction histidine kinase